MSDIILPRLTVIEAQIRTSPDIEADVNARTIDDAAAPHTRADAEADIVYPPKCHFNSFSEDIRCTPLSRQQNDIFISGWISFPEIDLSGCLVAKSLMQAPIVVKVQVSGQAAASLTG
jgi:hypothetical protein